MTKRITLTEDNIIESSINEVHIYTKGDNGNLKQQILDDYDKIDKITKFAKELAYSNPHTSWQLKKLLDGSTK